MESWLYITYFDNSGFKIISQLDISEDKRAMWAALAGKPQVSQLVSVKTLIGRAMIDRGAHPEVWTFWSPKSTTYLKKIAKEQPEELADLIRAEGTKIYTPSIRKAT